MHKLINYVCDELEELEKKADKGGLTANEIAYADTLAHLKKNLLKSEEMMDGGEYSGTYRSDMPRGMSYARGDYSRGDGRGSYAQRRDSRGRYSSERGYSRDAREMADRLRDLMEDAPNETVRRDIERLMHTVEQM